jgi:carbonic anhydrase
VIRWSIVLLFTTVLPLTTNGAVAEEKRAAHFGYDNENGPAVWHTLNEHYSKCADGKNQSPINILQSSVVQGAKLSMDYAPTSLHIEHHEYEEDILDNGHTIQVNYDEESFLEVGNKKFSLKQFHFHTPSEHTINGMHYPMEMHLVHVSDSGELAVFGVFFERGKHNKNFDDIVTHLPDAPGEK